MVNLDGVTSALVGLDRCLVVQSQILESGYVSDNDYCSQGSVNETHVVNNIKRFLKNN